VLEILVRSGLTPISVLPDAVGAAHVIAATEQRLVLDAARACVRRGSDRGG
jgi:hypothetical protein